MLQQREPASLVRDLINTQVSFVERLLNLSLLSTELLAHEVRRIQGEPPDFAAISDTLRLSRPVAEASL